MTGVIDRDTAVALLDRLHRAQNDFYDEPIAACWLLPLDQHAFDAIWAV